jgi:hypothetical protein
MMCDDQKTAKYIRELEDSLDNERKWNAHLEKVNEMLRIAVDELAKPQQHPPAPKEFFETQLQCRNCGEFFEDDGTTGPTRNYCSNHCFCAAIGKSAR